MISRSVAAAMLLLPLGVVAAGARPGARAVSAAMVGGRGSHQKAAAKQPAQPATAEIYGTVFNPDGFGVAGAQVSVRLHPPAQAQSKAPRAMRLRTNAIGEFVARVPAGAADYDLSISARGYQSTTARVHVYGDEKETIFLHLKPSGRHRKKG